MRPFLRRILLAATVVALTTTLRAAPPAPAQILGLMQSVADWQIAQPDTNQLGWVAAVGDTGISALAGISGDTRYRDFLVALGERNAWAVGAPRGRRYHADDQCIGQTYAELYDLYRSPAMIAPLRARFDYILAHPSTVTNLDFKQPHGRAQELWSWCDSLFMAPTAWLQVSVLTGDPRYHDFALREFWRTTDYLYDPDEHLYFRDSTYFTKREANGQKVFWSRGNGWVLAGLARLLAWLPDNDPDRPRIEAIYRAMAAKVLSLQQPDGFWRSSLLDPEHYPAQEASGTGLFTFGLAWGVNHGLLDRAQYEPALERAWAALASCVNPDGKLTHVQPVGAAPGKYSPDSTDRFGVGAFLLAGSELYRLAVLDRAQPVRVTVSNPAPFWRENETVEVKLAGQLAVLDDRSARILPSQQYNEDPAAAPDTLLFQTDLAPGQTRTYQVVDAHLLPAVPPALVKTFARYVPERYQDFCWESDRIAHRTYGQALIKAEGTISSGPDVWIKKNRGLICDQMYRSKHYHEDNGTEMDDYRVGASRGCGGLGIWDGQKLHVSSNYRHWRLITTGPIRSEFELTYDAWDGGAGRTVSEVRRISIDAGSWFSHLHTVLQSADPAPLTVGVGLAERACGTQGTELVAQDQAAGWLSYWQPRDGTKGVIGVAIVLPAGSVQAFTNDAPDLPAAKIHFDVPQPTHEGAPALRDLLAITQTRPGQPLDYYFGACWDRSGDFTNQEQWAAYVRRVAERRDQPVRVTLAN